MRDELYIYWIDRNGGSHFHVKGCPMLSVTANPRYHYEPVVRTRPRESPYSVIGEGSKVYMPCACILPKRGKE